MAFVPSIQAFLPSQGNVIEGGFPLWSAGKIIIGMSDTGAGIEYLSRFDFPTGVEEVITAIPSGSVVGSGVDPQGNSVFSSSNIQNFDSYTQYDINFVHKADYGTPDSGWNVPDGLPYPISGMAGMAFGNQTVIAGSTSAHHTDPDSGLSGYMVWFLSGTPFGYFGFQFADENSIIAVPGFSDGTSATFFLIGGPGADSDPQHLALYTVPVDKVGSGLKVLITNSIVPTTIDSDWTHIYHAGMVYDQTDGNLIVPLASGLMDGAANPHYICKFNSATGDLMWKVAVPSVNISAYYTRYGRIRHGKFCWFAAPGGSASVTVIDTLAGTSSSYSSGLHGVTGSAQHFDDTTGAIFLDAGYVASGDHPVQRNDTPGIFDGWSALYVIEAFKAPPVPLSQTSYTNIWGNYP